MPTKKQEVKHNQTYRSLSLAQLDQQVEFSALQADLFANAVEMQSLSHRHAAEIALAACK
jgi:hypothetical protein